jgi:hypothetical protein
MADELTTLLTKITATETELQAVKGKISVIEGGGDDLAKEHGYSTRIAALENLRTEKVALINKEVELRKDLRSAKEQQSGAGTSMVPVRNVPWSKIVLHTPANLAAFRSACLLRALSILHSYGLVLLHTCTAYLHTLENRMHCQG